MVLLLALLVWPMAPLLRAQPPTEDGIIRLDVPGVVSRDLGARFAGDTLYLSYSSFTGFLGIINHVSSNRDTLSAEYPLGEPVSIIRSAGVARRRTRELALAPGSVLEVDDELYVEATMLCRVLGLSIQLDIAELKLTIVPDSRLPVVEQARNRLRYAALGGGRDGEPAHAAPSIRRELFGSIAFDWSLLGTLQRGNEGGAGVVQLGGPFLYGVLNLGLSGELRRLGPTPVRASLDHAGWQMTFPDLSLLQRVSVEMSPGIGRGSYAASLSNIPVVPRRIFGARDLEGFTQPGWDVEMYEGNTLVEVTHADEQGRYRFTIPVGYGATTRTIQQVGPHGERISEQRSFQLNPWLIPSGEVQYTLRLSSLRLDTGSLDAGAADVAVGVTDRLTLGASASGTTSGFPRLGRDSVGLALVANLWLWDATSVGIHFDPFRMVAGGSFEYLSHGNLSVRLGLDSVGLREPKVASHASINVPLGAVSLGGSGRYERDIHGTTVEAAPTLSAYFAGIGCYGGMRFGWHGFADESSGELMPLQPVRVMTSTLQVTAAPGAGIFLSGRCGYDHIARALDQLELSSSINLTSALRLGMSWSMRGTEWRGGTVGLQIGFDIDAARTRLESSYQNGETMGSLYMQGTATISAAGIRPLRLGGVGQSAIVLRAFNDANLNGVRDGGEEILDDATAQLFCGGSEYGSEDGAFLSLSPNQACIVRIDREQFLGRGLYPRQFEFGVFTVQSTTHVIDIPFAEGNDISGHADVMLAGREKRLSTTILTGLAVHLVSIGGTADYLGELFDDGSILIAGVAPGDYRIVFDEKELASRQLGLRNLPERVTIDAATTRLPTITFIPADVGIGNVE